MKIFLTAAVVLWILWSLFFPVYALARARVYAWRRAYGYDDEEEEMPPDCVFGPLTRWDLISIWGIVFWSLLMIAVLYFFGEDLKGDPKSRNGWIRYNNGFLAGMAFFGGIFELYVGHLRSWAKEISEWRRSR